MLLLTIAKSLTLLFLQLLCHLRYLRSKGVKEVFDKLLGLVLEKDMEVFEHDRTSGVTFDANCHNVLLHLWERVITHHLLILSLKKFVARSLQLGEFF